MGDMCIRGKCQGCCDRADKAEAALARLVDKAADQAFDGVDWDGCDIQDFLEREGHILKTKYDPKKHGESNVWDVEPGDDWYVLAPHIEQALATGKEVGGE